MKPPQRFKESDTEWIDVEYNHLGQPYKETDQDGYVTLITFDSQGREELLITKDGYTKMIRNKRGLRIKRITEDGSSFLNFYDDMVNTAFAKNNIMLWCLKGSKETGVATAYQAMREDEYLPEHLIELVMNSTLDQTSAFIQGWLETCEEEKRILKYGHNI